MLTKHALLRVENRISNLNAQVLMHKAESVASSNLHGSIALKIADLDNFILPENLPYRERQLSNGNQIWAVIREQSVVTYFFRRSDQKQTAESMHVDRILIATSKNLPSESSNS